MRIIIAAVGKLKPGPELDLCELFARRLSWDLDVREVEEKRRPDGPERTAREGELLDQAVPEGVFRVALDRTGKELDSPAFANQIQNWMNEGVSGLAFLIGGADGLAADIRSTARMTLSLGPMTWPHFLARGLLLEQLYRAQCILSRHPYHR